MTHKKPRKRPLTLAVVLLALPFLALNGIAFMQARAMTHFVTVGQRTAKPEKLSLADKAKVILTGVEVPRPENTVTPKSLGLEYETQRILIGAEYLEIWCIEPAQQSRGIVLLFPPYGGSKAGLLAPAQILHELGYETVLVDFRGVGGSSGSDTTLGVREAKDVAIAFQFAQRHTQSHPRPIFLYGASMGAVAVMRAVAIEGIQPTGLILESPFDRLLNTVRHRFEAMGIPAFPSAELLVLWGSALQRIDGFNHNPVDYARQVRSPVLLLHGALDSRVTEADARRVFNPLPEPKTWRVFPDANGHGSLAADAPAEWRSLISQFLDDFS
jgi:uncharacterized protein